MTGLDALSDQLAEVAKLATAIADHMLEQNASGTTIPPQQFTMLVSAARMLQDNGAPWPPSVEQVVMEVAQRVEQAEAVPENAEVASAGNSPVVHLSQSLRAVKRT